MYKLRRRKGFTVTAAGQTVSSGASPAEPYFTKTAGSRKYTAAPIYDNRTEG